MSAAPDWGPGAPVATEVWETLALLTEVVDGIAAVQRETAETLAAVLELQREQHAVVNELAFGPEWEAAAAHAPTAGLVAQAYQSRLQSSRLIARAQELAARAERLMPQPQQVVNDGNVSVLGRRARDRATVPEPESCE